MSSVDIGRGLITKEMARVNEEKFHILSL